MDLWRVCFYCLFPSWMSSNILLNCSDYSWYFLAPERTLKIFQYFDIDGTAAQLLIVLEATICLSIGTSYSCLKGKSCSDFWVHLSLFLSYPQSCHFNSWCFAGLELQILSPYLCEMKVLLRFLLLAVAFCLASRSFQTRCVWIRKWRS